MADLTLPTVNSFNSTFQTGPAVVTSKAAQTELAKAQTTASQLNTDIQNQAQKNATVNNPTPTPPVKTPTSQTNTSTGNVNLPSNPSTGGAGANADISKAGQPGYDVFGNPVIGGAASVQSARASGGTYTGSDGKQYYKYDSTPVGSTDTSGTTSTFTADQNGIITANADILADKQAQLQAAQTFAKTISDIRSGAIPLTSGQQAQIDSLNRQYQQLIDQQNIQNTGAVGTANIRGYQTGAGEYDPTFQAKTIGSIASAGAQKVADLQTKLAGAVASLTTAFQNDNIADVKSAYDTLKTAQKDYDDSLNDFVTRTTAAIKDAQAQAEQAKKDQYEQVTKPIQDIATEAAKNGASASTLAAINKAATVSDAVAAAGGSLQTATGQLGDYLQYKRDAVAKGLTPSDYTTWKAQDDARQAKLKSSEAYATAYATAAGKAAAENIYGVGGTPDSPTPDSTATGVTGAAGLSLQAFNYLTQGTASMSRMPASQRNAIMKEANDWLNKNGIDISTFQSQYKAYNDVLQKNIARANQTKVMAGEVSGSADALIKAIEEGKPGNPFNSLAGGMSSIRASNVLDLMLGKETNNKFAQTYSTQIAFMANDLAGYLAAARGASSPELQDQRDAASIISNGMNTGSTEAFRDAVIANEEKVAGVVTKAANDAQKQVWDLFGVGGQFKPKAPQINPKDAVDNYVKANPKTADTVAKLYEVPGATDQDVLDYINQLNK